MPGELYRGSGLSHQQLFICRGPFLEDLPLRSLNLPVALFKGLVVFVAIDFKATFATEIQALFFYTLLSRTKVIGFGYCDLHKPSNRYRQSSVTYPSCTIFL
jgi:hypothetical protein